MTASAEPDDAGARVARQLLALAREELEIVRNGDPDDLAELAERRAVAMAELPSSFTPAARALLEQAVEVQQEVSALLQHSMGVLRGEMGLVARGRRLAHGYTPVRTPRRALLDRSA